VLSASGTDNQRPHCWSASELVTLELARISVSLAGIAVAMLGHGELSHISACPPRDLFRAPMTVGE